MDTPYGQLRIGVDYQPASTVTILEQTTSPPALPQIIADYVGGGGGSGEASSRAARAGAGGSGASAAARPLRHALSTSAVGPSALPQALTPTASGPPSAAQPGSSLHQAVGRAGGSWPIRRSWSTSLRGVSPHRALSQPPSELPSPTTGAQDTPYGSAPQAVSPARSWAAAGVTSLHANPCLCSLRICSLERPLRAMLAPSCSNFCTLLVWGGL